MAQILKAPAHAATTGYVATWLGGPGISTLLGETLPMLITLAMRHLATLVLYVQEVMPMLVSLAVRHATGLPLYLWHQWPMLVSLVVQYLFVLAVSATGLALCCGVFVACFFAALCHRGSSRASQLFWVHDIVSRGASSRHCAKVHAGRGRGFRGCELDQQLVHTRRIAGVICVRDDDTLDRLCIVLCAGAVHTRFGADLVQRLPSRTWHHHHPSTVPVLLEQRFDASATASWAAGHASDSVCVLPGSAGGHDSPGCPAQCLDRRVQLVAWRDRVGLGGPVAVPNCTLIAHGIAVCVAP